MLVRHHNDVILIGGPYFKDLNIGLIADIGYFEDFFNTVRRIASDLEKNESMAEWLHGIAPNIDTKAFAHMYTFENVLRAIYPHMSSNISKRQNYYDTSCNKKLSQSFKDGVCACSEISILAQAYFQKQGFDTQYCGGHVVRSLKNKELEAEPHSFISIKTNDEPFFYVPSSPILVSGNHYPRVSTIEATPSQIRQFENKIHSESGKNSCSFLEAKNILSGTRWYYGYGDGYANGDIHFPSYIFSKNNMPPISSRDRSL